MVTDPWLRCLLVVTIAVSYICFDVHANFGLTSTHPVLGLVKDLMRNQSSSSITSSSTTSSSSSSMSPSGVWPSQFDPGGGGGGAARRNRQLCEVLKLGRRQRRMCRRDNGVAAGLLEAVRLSTSSCQQLFRYERWNCSIGQYRTKLLRQGRGFRETSFLHAITAASLTHTFAQACSNHRLDRCTCANPKAWKWGGCGDNIRYAGRFTRRFLSSRRKHRDIQASVDYHNSLIGIKAVRQERTRACKCHGVSGSCATKTCWTRVAPFYKTALRLKRLYQQAEQVVVDGNSSGELLLGSGHGLVYSQRSPNFCSPGPFSPGVVGRVCRDAESCDRMCCGRGYNTRLVTVDRACRCRFIWCCETVCKTCRMTEEVHTCK